MAWDSQRIWTDRIGVGVVFRRGSVAIAIWCVLIWICVGIPTSARAGSRHIFTLGTGASYYDYHERANSRHVNEWAWTGKMSYTLVLVPKRLEASLGGYATIADLSHSPQTLDPAMFYGINGRLGFPLQITNRTRLTISPGYYAWSMSTGRLFESTRQYGVIGVSGPQILCMLAIGGVWIYGKYAIVSNGSTSINASESNEMAAGLGINLTKNPERALAVTIDVARIRFADDSNAMELMSFTAGLQKAF